MNPSVTRLAVLVCLGLGAARATLAQDLTPRAYLITPVGTNALVLSYSHLEGEVEFAGALPITDAEANINLGVLSYIRSLNLFGRTATVAVAVPYGDGDWQGNVVNVPRNAHRSGSLDAVMRFAVNLLGGPAMEPAEFRRWRQTSLLGASLTIVPPTGQYDPTRLINWGANRWGFKPEIGYSRRLDQWILDGYAGVWFFTTNSEFYPGMNSQTQKPVGALEAHVSYDFKPRLWISLDANYWWGGATSLNGVENTLTDQKSSRAGLTGSFPISARQSIKLSFSRGAYIRYGGNYKSISLGWLYGWIGKPGWP